MRYGTPGNYSVDHFRPKSRPEFRKLICRYSNLFYACRECNLYKSSTWPSKHIQSLGFRFLDPCRVDLSDHWTVSEDGTLKPKNFAAEYMIERLRLNRPNLRDWRLDKKELANRIGSLVDRISSAKSRDEDLANALQPLLERLTRQIEGEYGDYWGAAVQG